MCCFKLFFVTKIVLVIVSVLTDLMQEVDGSSKAEKSIGHETLQNGLL